MAAVLACGDGAALSHRSAAALWGIGEGETQSDRRLASVARERPAPTADSRCTVASRCCPGTSLEHRGIPVTTPVQTLLDHGDRTRRRERLERAVNEADKRDLVDPETLRHRARRAPRASRGCGRCARCSTATPSGSPTHELERPLPPDRGAQPAFPSQRPKRWVNGFEVDFYWPDLGLVVETDGFRYHRTAASPDPRRAPRPDPHRLRPDAAALLPLAGQARTAPRRRVLATTAARLRR